MLFYYLNLIGIFFFTISGSLAARDKKHYHDYFGVFFTGFLTAIGGGTLRDIILGDYPISWIKDANILLSIIIAFLFTLFFKNYIIRLRRTLFLFDTIGVGIYTILGLQKSLDFHVNPFAAIILGLISAVFGGVIRDTLLNEIPLIFAKEIYATACIAGAVAYSILTYLGVSENLAAPVCMILIIAIRIIAVKYKLALPKFDFGNETKD
ncbi:MAG: trimeric intracellular cation channel family protein [Bacteroidetes bacterium]|nr:trimeric intracellular cation channel family protein [Bacteroidota bacterium]